MPQAHLVLYLCCGGLLLAQVEFSQLMRLKHIWPYAFTVIDFSSHGLGFPDSQASSTFCHMPHLRHSIFLFTRIEFSQFMCLKYIFSCTSIIINFFSNRSNFLDLRAWGTFCPTLPPWYISIHVSRVFSTYKPRIHFVLCLHRGEFFIA